MVCEEVETVRELRISDIYALHKMYDSFSEESKRFFHPGFLGFKSISFSWFLAQAALAASSFTIFKRLLLQIFPSAFFLAIVSSNKAGEIIGFAFVKVKSPNIKKNLVGDVGICVRDDYRGKRVGSKMMSFLLQSAKNEHFHGICLQVLTENLKAIHLYEKYGFKMSLIKSEGDVWRGKRFDSVEMCLNLS